MSFRVLEGLDYRFLAGPLGEGPLIREAYRGLKVPNQRVLSRHPSEGRPIGLSSWHAKFFSANQDLVCRSLYELCSIVEYGTVKPRRKLGMMQ